MAANSGGSRFVPLARVHRHGGVTCGATTVEHRRPGYEPDVPPEQDARELPDGTQKGHIGRDGCAPMRVWHGKKKRTRKVSGRKLHLG
jgi:hypothetical protein